MTQVGHGHFDVAMRCIDLLKQGGAISNLTNTDIQACRASYLFQVSTYESRIFDGKIIKIHQSLC